jgi:hypothetical protein
MGAVTNILDEELHAISLIILSVIWKIHIKFQNISNKEI